MKKVSIAVLLVAAAIICTAYSLDKEAEGPTRAPVDFTETTPISIPGYLP